MSDRRDDILDYLDGEMDETRQAELHDWLNQSPERWDQLAELSFVHSAIGEQLRKEESAALFRIDALHGLPELEGNDNKVTKQDVAAALSYVVYHTFTPRRLAVLASAAALLVLVVTLAVVMSGSQPTDTAPEIAQTPDQPAAAAPVATLTASHDAQWSGPASADLAPGDPLHPGDRFTLSQGLAEITTNAGAIAILEAPATVELLDNNNALRLHSGKLVGICETPSSKGLLVRTPHMDITDLGTRFGVDASDTAATQVHVLEGEVQVASNSGIFSTERLRAGESARGSSIVSQLVRITFDPSLFDAPALGAVAHLGTGQNLAPGTADPDWQIVAIDGMTLDQPVMVEVADPSKFTNTIRENLRFMPNVPSRSQWITLPDSIDFESIQETVTYQTRFDTTGLDLSMLQAKLRFVADNQIKSIGLNGQLLRVPPHATDMDYTHMTAIPIEQGLVQGENTLTLTVRRYRVGTTNHYWTGLRTELELIDRRLRVGPNE